MFSLKFFLIFALSFWPLGSGNETNVPLKKTSLDLPKSAEEFTYIRILLMNNVPEITLDTPSPFQVKDKDGHVLFKGEKMAGTRIRANASGVQIGSQVFHDAPIAIESAGDGIKIDKHVYRHALKIWRESNGKLLIVNEIAIEDYLKGVLPWEANPKWSMEALKAQAVASRTYALFKAIENRDEKFALSKDVLSQVYGGKNSEKFATTQAVNATEGEILTYKNKIFPAYFHSTCGGMTTHAEYLWDVEPHPALKGVECNFCRGSKHYRWESAFSAKDVEARLHKKGFDVSGIKAITPTDIDASGRAKLIVIEHAKGESKFHSNEFRIWMDPMRFKSTLITSVEREGDNFFFRGRGWGHGVGLCQYGMKQLSEIGYTYKQILQYYYPGSEINRAGSDRPKNSGENRNIFSRLREEFI